MGSRYTVVNIPILTSPCRNCADEGCIQSRCQKLKNFNAECDRECTGYGVATPDGYGCQEFTVTY